MKTFKDLEFVPIRDGHQGVTSTMFFDNHYGVFVNSWEGSLNAQQGVLADLYELTIIDKVTNKLVHSIPPLPICWSPNRRRSHRLHVVRTKTMITLSPIDDKSYKVNIDTSNLEPEDATKLLRKRDRFPAEWVKDLENLLPADQKLQTYDHFNLVLTIR